MKLRILLLFFMLFGFIPISRAQVFINGTITSSGADCGNPNSCVSLGLPRNTGGAGIGISTGYSGTIQFEGSADGINWTALSVTPIAGGSAITSTSGVGAWSVNVAGLVGVRVRASSLSSGTPQITIQSSSASASTKGSGGGGGSGCTPSGSSGNVLVDNGSGGCNSVTALTNGITATTQTSSDNSTKVATDAFVQANLGANAALSNLSGVSINTSLLAQTGSDLGGTSNPFRNLYIFGAGTYGSTYLKLTGTPTSTRTLTIPDATDTFGLLAATQTFTNKTISGSSNTISNIQCSALPALTGDATTSATSCATTVVALNGTSLGGLATGILKNTTTTGVPSIAIAGDFPTLNQNTTGSAAKWTTARNLAGNSVDGSANVAFANKFIVQGTTDAGLTNAQFLGALATGLVYNTTTTGVLTTATSSNVNTVIQGLTGCNTVNYVYTPQGGACVANSGSISGLTTGYFPIAASSSTIANSHCDDGITTTATVTCSEPVTVSAGGPSSVSVGIDNSAAGTLVLSNGSANAHTIFGSVATTTNTIDGFAAAPTTGDLIKCVTSSTTCTLTDTGTLAANVVNASSPGAGIARFAGSTQTVTSAELSGDATTSGSNAVTVVKINGTAFSGTNGHLVSFGASNIPADSGVVASTVAATTSCDGTTSNQCHAIAFAFGSPGGTALSTGVLGYFTVPFACTIRGWSIQVDAGTATIKWLKVASGTAIPTLGSNSISTSGVAISTGTVVQSTTLTDFTTTTVTANDIMAADLTVVSGVGYISAQVACSN